MILDELKTIIEQKTGIPTDLLSGETAEDIISSARALLDLKRREEMKREKPTREQFAEWFSAVQGEELSDPESIALEKIAEVVRSDNGGYPMPRDGGDVTDLPDMRPTREKFREWFEDKTAFDPRKNRDGWKRIP